MPGHEVHLARAMKLVGHSTLEDRPLCVAHERRRRRLCGDRALQGESDAGGRLKYEPPMDSTLSGEAKRYIENALIAGTHACAAEANVATIGAVVDRLGQ